jgi:hypothetical protein
MFNDNINSYCRCLTLIPERIDTNQLTNNSAEMVIHSNDRDIGRGNGCEQSE